MSPIFGAPRGDLPKKRHGVRIGERKYSTIFTNFHFFASCDTPKSCVQVVDNKQVASILDCVESLGFFSFLIRRLQVQVLSGVLDIKSIISSVCGTYEFQLYGLLKLIKHRNYDVWKGDVAYAKTERSEPEKMSGQKSMLFVV